MAETHENVKQSPEAAYIELQQLAQESRDLLKEYLKLDKQVKERKAKIKNLMEDAAIDTFEDGGVKIWLTRVDKSYLHKESTLRYLKDKGLNDLVVVTESFDDASILMAAHRGRINLADLAQFKIDKEEVRLNIR